MADREADYKQREKDLKEMKKNTKAKVDDDINDDGVDLDGDGIADVTQGVSAPPRESDGEGWLALPVLRSNPNPVPNPVRRHA